MRVGVIGGAGFVGSFLQGQLRRHDHIPIVFDIAAHNGRPDHHRFDVTQCGAGSDLFGADAIINLAAVHRDDVKPLSKYAEVNVEGLGNCVRRRFPMGLTL